MFSFLQRDIPAAGRVLFRGAIPPPVEQLPALLAVIEWRPAPTSPDQLWAIEGTHPNWGMATIACLRHPAPLGDVVIDHTISLSDDEREQARLGESALTVRIAATQKHILRDRKRLLWWLKQLMNADGVVAVDETSTLLWSRAMLEDELAHEADLDIESLYAIHAVHADNARPGAPASWLHTHGLEEVGAFDVDVLEPSPSFVSNCADPLRAIAFAAVEGTLSADSARFDLAHPGGAVRLVPVSVFHQLAEPRRRVRRPWTHACGEAGLRSRRRLARLPRALVVPCARIQRGDRRRNAGERTSSCLGAESRPKERAQS